MPLGLMPLGLMPLGLMPLGLVPLGPLLLTWLRLTVRLMWPLLGDLLLTSNRYPLTLARTSIRMCALTAHRKPFAMAKPLVAADLDLSLDILRNFATEVALDLVVGIDELANTQDFCVCEIADFRVVINFERTEELVRPRSSDPEDIGETYLNPLVSREVNSGNACHSFLTPVAACGEGFRKSPRRGHAAG
jgi:hypothetical protein